MLFVRIWVAKQEKILLQTLDFNLTGLGEIVELPGLIHAIRSVVDQQIEAACVLPNKIVVPLTPHVDITKLYFSEPEVHKFQFIALKQLNSFPPNFFTVCCYFSGCSSYSLDRSKKSGESGFCVPWRLERSLRRNSGSVRATKRIAAHWRVCDSPYCSGSADLQDKNYRQWFESCVQWAFRGSCRSSRWTEVACRALWLRYWQCGRRARPTFFGSWPN